MESLMTKTALVIDGDIFLWECGLSVEEPIHWGDDLWTLHADAYEARLKFDIALADLKEKTGAVTLAICFSGAKNWRKEVLPTYKFHRKKSRKPVVFHDLRDYARQTYRTYEFPQLEADDVCGMIMDGALWSTKLERILVSTDKDLLQIPGLHYNHNKPEEGITEVSEEDGHYNHMFQALTGDLVDGYSGCPGVGPKTAAKLLDPDPTWDVVSAAYEKAGKTEEEALQQARVAKILRKKDFAFNNNEVILWEPR